MGDDEHENEDAGIDFDLYGTLDCPCDICDVYGPGSCAEDDPDFDLESV